MGQSFPMMLGLPGQGMHLGIDPLSAIFLGILLPRVLASAIAGTYRSVTFWVCVLGMGLALTGRDAFALIFGLGLMSAAFWVMVVQTESRAANFYAGTVMFSGACLVPAVFLPAGGIAFGLILLSGGAAAGVVVLAGGSTMLSGGIMQAALYVLIRYGFIMFGAADALWWGVLLIGAGTVCSLTGALRAMLETDLQRLLAVSTVQHVGLIATGLGIALRAKAMGDPVLAALALQAALFWVVAQALFMPMLALGAAAVGEATGTASLDWLGGLIRGMPRLGLLMLMAASGMAFLPLGPGFAGQFLLLHAVIGAAASGGIMARIGFACVLAVLGLGAALSLGAGVRLIGTGFLGRPRSLRAAAAEEAPRPVLAGMALLGVCCVPVALLPGLVLRGIQPAIRLMIPNAPMPGFGYHPLPLAMLLVFFGGAAFLLLHYFGARGGRQVRAWNGGFGKPPAWLPFGNPATQPTATGFAEPVRRVMAVAWLGGVRGAWFFKVFAHVELFVDRIVIIMIRGRIALVFAVLVAFLLAVGLGQTN